MSEEDPESGSSGPPVYCDFIVDYSQGACYQGVLQYGDNGPGPEPELIVNGNGAQFSWQAPHVVQFDSGGVSVEFAVRAGGGATLTAAKGTQVGSAGDNSLTHQYITGVQIGAAVLALPGRRMSWSSVAVKYYRNGQLTEAYPLQPECCPVATTVGVSGPAFQAVRRNPAASNNDAVTVTGVIRLEGNRGNPNFEFGPSDFYAKILVFTNNCVPR
jgi:hypothetical protein